MNRRAVLIEVLRVAIVIVVALVLSFVVILIISKEPGDAFKQFITGPLANRNRQGNWLVQATALTFTGLSVALVFQARQFALGAEGQLYLGGLAAGFVALYLPGSAWVVAIVAFLAAALAGFLYGLIPGYLKAYFGANEIVSTLMLNAIATAGYAFILVRYLRVAGGNYSASFTVFGPTGQMRPLIEGTQVSAVIFLALVLAVGVHVLLYHTTFGYELRMSGFNLRFAEYGGINVRRTITLAMGLSGMVAGIAGAGLILGSFGRVNPQPSNGYGLDGIVVALLARNYPLATIPAALFYSYLRVGADVMGQNTDVPFEMANVIQGIIILLISADALTRWLRVRRSNRAGQAGRDTLELPTPAAPQTITNTQTTPTASEVSD